ncbi:SDR family NAD(P)-dependent oxidoreductase [Streptomyces sp. HUAS CX7]|uniref:SDR family NAD(P)-dependent oxidoreductase n=1 Tax=Streptomyces sp. HUAS CX7 TaxID=3062782 RepID=UPI0026ED3A0F|nr:SDR family NAD(P)-dependent oxidoreductase [Streptomyces sp. HUAS CX7]WKX23191.1 SDR family NAD(P)-dependent oxidoreductase [Streptomyces sp. HUAS CX7]
MEGKIVLVTGSTGGIGMETARQLAALGASVILVGRDKCRADAAVADLRHTSGNDDVTAITADLSRLRDVRRLAQEAGDRAGVLDVLINNAGATRSHREVTEDGIETAFAVNVVAPFCLTHWLMPALTSSGQARVINITGGIPRGRIDFNNLHGEKSYVGLSFYNQTKLAQMAMSYRFAQELAATPVTLNVAYPGHAYTSMNKNLTVGTYPPLARPIVPLLRLAMPVVYGHRALLRATRSSVYLASSPEERETNGAYFNSRAKPTPWPDAVLDDTTRNTIWELCEMQRERPTTA